MNYLKQIKMTITIVWFTSLVFSEAVFGWSGDTYDYTRIDSHAIKAPKEVEGSIKSLVEYLVRPTRNDLEKLRSVFTWIAHNISYDSAMRERKVSSREVAPAIVFKKRTTICSGYANLAKRMMTDAIGKNVFLVNGNSKGYGYELHSHAWNAVKLEDIWYFIDCTWGAGYLNEKKEFTQKFNDFYFLTPPEVNIYTHFPDKPSWQRIVEPISVEKFKNLIRTTPNYFKYGLNLESHSKSVIEADSSLNLNLVFPEDLLVSASLHYGEENIYDRYLFIQREGDECELKALFPATGEYTLRLYAKPRESEGSYKEVLSYLVKIGRANSWTIGFPTVFKGFKLHEVILYCPLTGFLRKGVIYKFKLKIPGANKAAVVQDKKWHNLSRKVEIFQTDLTLEPGIAGVYAIFPGMSDYTCLLEYKVVKGWGIRDAKF